MNNTINIYFKGNNSGGTPSNPEEPSGQIDSQNTESSTAGQSTKNAQSGVMTYGKYALKNAISYATQNVGTWTGSSYLQTKVNSTMKLAGYGVAIATNPVMGSLALATDLITSNIDYAIKSNRASATLSITSQRAGNVNRSR